MIDLKELPSISFFGVFKDMLDFVKKPIWNHLPTNFLENPLKIFPYILGIDFILLFFLAPLLAATGVGEMEHEIQKLADTSFLKLGLFAIILAPILEEIVFRLPLGPWLGKYFRLDFWLLTVLFAALHLTNFSSEVPFYLLPILVLPQFVLGVILGYIRTGWGIGYSILFHALHNGITFGLMVLGTMAEASS